MTHLRIALATDSVPRPRPRGTRIGRVTRVFALMRRVAATWAAVAHVGGGAHAGVALALAAGLRPLVAVAGWGLRAAVDLGCALVLGAAEWRARRGGAAGPLRSVVALIAHASTAA